MFGNCGYLGSIGLWLPRLSSSTICNLHSLSCRLTQTLLHTCHCPSDLSTVLTFPICWGCAWPSGLSGSSQCQAPAISMTLQSYCFYTTKANIHKRCLYITKLSCLRDSPGSVWTTASVCWPWRNTPQRLHLNDADLLLVTDDFSALANQHQSKAKVSFQCLWSLVIGDSTPANQKPQVLNSKYRTDSPDKVFEDWQMSF